MHSQGRYTILGEIASGATATVYLAEDVVLRRKVALKKLHPHLWNHAETVRRFEKEAVAVASLSHENIIKVYDFGSQDRGLFLAMEYVDGTSLEILAKEAPEGLPNLTALSLFHQILSGLAAAHQAGIYHRDIKPSNVLVDTKGCVRIADFGIAFLSEETSITKTGSYLGTPGYSAPEQAQGLAATDKTDIFATGVLFYRCLTGKHPFEAETPHAVLIAIMERMPPKANMVNRRMLPGLAELVEEMLAKVPGARPSANRCLEKLEMLAGKHGFPLDTGCICRFTADPQGYAQSESREIALGFAAQARRAQVENRPRDAMKHFSLAEIFAEADSEVDREASRYLKRQAALLRRRKWAGALLALLCLTGAGKAWNRLFPPGPPASLPTAKPPIARSEPQPQPPPALRKAAAVPSTAHPTSQAPDPSAAPPSSSGTAVASATRPRPKRPNAPLAPATTPNNAPINASPEPAAAAMEPAAAVAMGYLLVKSNPPFAKVRIDGKPAGTTPIKVPLEIEAGVHQVDLEREGCAPFQSGFKIAPGETTSLRFTLDRDAAADP